MLAFSVFALINVAQATYFHLYWVFYMLTIINIAQASIFGSQNYKFVRLGYQSPHFGDFSLKLFCHFRNVEILYPNFLLPIFQLVSPLSPQEIFHIRHTFTTFSCSVGFAPRSSWEYISMKWQFYTATFRFFVIMIFCNISSVNSGGGKKHSWHRKKNINWFHVWLFPLLMKNDLEYSAHE